MKLNQVLWSDLKVGQSVSLKMPALRGTIVKLDYEPMIWISWDDGNRNEYNQSILGHVELLEEHGSAQTDFDSSHSYRLIVDSEGE